MADGAEHDFEGNTGNSAKKRPDQAIYRPGMFKRGIDLTQTKPRAENQPPPSERKLQQLKRQQEREKSERSHGPAAASAGYQNPRQSQQYRSLPPSGRERNYNDPSYQQPNGYHGGYNRGRGGGGGGYRPRNNDFDSRSVRSNRKQTYRPSKQRFPSDTRSEVAHNDDTQSIASTTFSTDTANYNNGFASELNSRHTSFQSLLGADLQNFDWVAALEDDTPLSCLENLPETDSTGNQEDDLSSERTPISTPRKVSVTVDHVAEEEQLPTPVSVAERTPGDQQPEMTEIREITKKIEELNDFKENEEIKSVEEKSTEKISENRQLLTDDSDGSFSIKTPIQQTLVSLKSLNEKLQSVFSQKDLPEMTEEEIVEYLKSVSQEFNQLIKNIHENKGQPTVENNEVFRACALDAMKVRQFAENAVQMIAVRKNNYILSIVTDITMKSLFVVSALLVYSLESSRKFQLIDSFEGIWQKLISRVKLQVTAFGKNVVIQLITLIRSSISTVCQFAGVDDVLGDLVKAVQGTEFKGFSQALVLPKDSPNPLKSSETLLNFAGSAYRWQGDLSRYQAMILGSTDYDPSLKFYFLSFIFDPQNGTSLNQMGAVASYKTSSELLHAVFLFTHALTTSKPFAGSEGKLGLLLSSPEHGHDGDPNTERLEFTQHFLLVAHKAFTGDNSDMSLAVEKVMNLFGEIFGNDVEMTVFTSGDLIYQIGILWSLICLEKVKEEHKVMLKQMLMTYLENLAGKLLTMGEIQNPSELEAKLAFIVSPLCILAQIFPHIGGNKIPDPHSLDLSLLLEMASKLSKPNEPSQVALPEVLLTLHGNKNYPSEFMLFQSPTSDPSVAAIATRLSLIIAFLSSFSSATQ
ncbi:hypothetical protein FO519_006081 [Halicephalobus sp. NKZ332]|nr:hypothetical protein FO519_006081 [Halicephalobus sp. NKZ332]